MLNWYKMQWLRALCKVNQRPVCHMIINGVSESVIHWWLKNEEKFCDFVDTFDSTDWMKRNRPELSKPLSVKERWAGTSNSSPVFKLRHCTVIYLLIILVILVRPKTCYILSMSLSTAKDWQLDMTVFTWFVKEKPAFCCIQRLASSLSMSLLTAKDWHLDKTALSWFVKERHDGLLISGPVWVFKLRNCTVFYILIIPAILVCPKASYSSQVKINGETISAAKTLATDFIWLKKYKTDKILVLVQIYNTDETIGSW